MDQPFIYEMAFPCPELHDFVSHFWFSQFHNGVQNSFSYHSTANTTTELVFAFAGHTNIFSSAQGHTGTYSRIETGGFSALFGVAIYSHALPFFFDVAATEFANQLTALSNITDVSAITEQLANAFDFDKRVELLTNYLKNRFNQQWKTDDAITHAIKYMRQQGGQVNILHMAGECSLSQKQFERRFKAFTGFNPKLYARILRFESCLCQYERSPGLTNLALESGYYDQAHFINEFKQFAGFTPGKYAPITLH